MSEELTLEEMTLQLVVAAIHNTHPMNPIRVGEYAQMALDIKKHVKILEPQIPKDSD